MKEEKKDFCTLFFENYRGVYIGDCCKKHDIECGFSGSYSIKKSIDIFYNCLINKIDKFSAIMITAGGTIGYIVKYPYLFIRKYKYRKKILKEK